MDARERMVWSDLRGLRAMLATVHPFYWAGPCLVVLGLLATLSEGLGIGLMMPLFAAIFDQGNHASGLAEALGGIGRELSQGQKIAFLASLILALAAVRSAILYAYKATSSHVSGQITHCLRVALFKQVLTVGYAFYANQDCGRLFNIVRGETWQAGEFLILGSRALISLCAVVVFGGFLMFISPPATVGAIAAAVIINLLVRVIAQRTRQLGNETVEPSAVLSRATIQALSSMRTIHLFGQEMYALDRFTQVSERDRAAEEKLRRATAMIHPLTELLYAPVFLGILLAAWVSEMDFPTLITFMILLYRLQPYTSQLDSIRVEMASQLPILEHIGALLQQNDKPYLVSGSKPFQGLREEIRFEDVSFVYESAPGERKPAVSGLTFTVRRNRVTAIVGGSGAGKSTVVNLLFRLFDPTSGRVLVDGIPLTELDVTEWRHRLAFAGQDTELIGDTVLDAVTFGRPTSDLAAVERACRRANASEFILKLPHGYNTPIGEHGCRLSAGQRQRLGLARALLYEPEVLVLDEATNALDAVTESFIQDAIQLLAGQMTVIVITHRLNTIRAADQIVVLQEGRLVEQGLPHELLEDQQGVFTQLWRLQGRAYEEPGGSTRATRLNGNA